MSPPPINIGINGVSDITEAASTVFVAVTAVAAAPYLNKAIVTAAVIAIAAVVTAAMHLNKK
jgi:hypothetical protein